MGKTSIQWTEFSVNPIRARSKSTGRVGHFCEKISPGCAHCYASEWNENRFGTGLPFLPVWRDSLELFLDRASLNQVLRRRKPTTYFWCNMSDLFLEHHPDEWIDACVATMALTPWHTHQVLTKRPARMAEYMKTRGYHSFNDVRLETEQWPPRNIWLGVSVEDQQRKGRIDMLREVPAAVRFLSLEPLLEDLGALDLAGIHWAILGGESGDGARACQVEWMRAIVRQCQPAQVPVFVKQLGAKVQEVVTDAPVYVDLMSPMAPTNRGVLMELKLRHPKGGDMEEWPEDLRLREFPR